MKSRQPGFTEVRSPLQAWRSAQRDVSISLEEIALPGTFTVPKHARGVVLFANGSGASRQRPRNLYLAQTLQQAGFATLLTDLLTADEELIDQRTATIRFDIARLTQRLIGVTWWLVSQPEITDLPIGYFGAYTGASAALAAASELGDMIGAIVSRGGRLPRIPGTTESLP